MLTRRCPNLGHINTFKVQLDNRKRSRGELRLIEEKLKVLKVMSEITSRIDMNTFAKMVGLNTNQTVERLQDLINSGFIKKIGGGYGITEKGHKILKAIKPVPNDTVFHFYTGFGQPTGFSAKSLKDFHEIVKRVALEALNFHLYRGDFEKWIAETLEDQELANYSIPVVLLDYTVPSSKSKEACCGVQ